MNLEDIKSFKKSKKIEINDIGLLTILCFIDKYKLLEYQILNKHFYLLIIPMVFRKLNIFAQTTNSSLIKDYLSWKFIELQMQNPKQFKLLYKGTRDGFKSQKLRDLCANKGDTLSIVKSG